MDNNNEKRGKTSIEKLTSQIGVAPFSVNEAVRARQTERPVSAPGSVPASKKKEGASSSDGDFQWTVRVPSHYKEVLRKLKFSNAELSYRDIAMEALDYLEQKYNL